MIIIKNLTKRFDGKTVLDNLNLCLPNVGLIILCGENGSGKSTLLNIIGLLDKPILGTVEIDGQNIVIFDEDEACRFREKYVSYIFQNLNLFEEMTVDENIKIVSGNKDNENLLSLLAIEELKNKKVKELSGGEKARVGIARALMKDSKILLADEPTASIDAESKFKIFDALKELSKNRLVIIVTHDMEMTDIYGDMVLTLSDGHISNTTIRNEIQKEANSNEYTNIFSPTRFAQKNLYSNKKKIARSSILLLISFFFLIVALSLSSLDFFKMQADTMVMEGDTDMSLTSLGFETDDSFTEESIAELKTELDLPLYIGKRIVVEGEPLRFEISYPDNWNDEESSYFKHRIANYFFYDECEYELEQGSYPTEENEVIISSYMAEQIIKFGIKDMEGNIYKPTNIEQLIENRKEIYLSGIPVIIKGISKMNLSPFSSLKDEIDGPLFKRMQSYVSELSNRVYVSPKFFQMFDKYRRTLDKNYHLVTAPKHYLFGSKEDLNFYVFDKPVLSKRTDELISTLQENEIVVNGRVLDALDISVENPIGATVKLYFENMMEDTLSEPIEFKIVGISSDNKNYMSFEAMQPYLSNPIKIERIDFRSTDKKVIEKVLKKYSWIAKDDKYIVKTNYSYMYDMLYTFCKMCTIFATIIGIVFTLLTLLFNLNYLFESAEEHRTQIATLKALGINNSKIYQIFLFEMMNITFKAYAFAVATFFLVRPISNLLVSYITSFKVNILPIPVISIFVTIIAFSLLNSILTFVVLKTIKKISPAEIFKADSI